MRIPGFIVIFILVKSATAIVVGEYTKLVRSPHIARRSREVFDLQVCFVRIFCHRARMTLQVALTHIECGIGLV